MELGMTMSLMENLSFLPYSTASYQPEVTATGTLVGKHPGETVTVCAFPNLLVPVPIPQSVTLGYSNTSNLLHLHI